MKCIDSSANSNSISSAILSQAPCGLFSAECVGSNSETTAHVHGVRMGWQTKETWANVECDVSVRMTRQPKQRASVLGPTCCTCWCTSCHCCHCPQWSQWKCWKCTCRCTHFYVVICSWIAVSGDVLFTPPVGDGRLRWLIPKKSR